MSQVQTETREPSFFDLYSRGEATADQIDDFVGRWHEDEEPWAKDMALHEYLGLSEQEYQVWIYDRDALPQILAGRRERQPLREVIANHLDALIHEDRRVNGTKIYGLRIWLGDREKSGSSN